mmetsp:Transcript_43759/g.69572  ORF Transcript_43759/g.69572 Transcript_43759/m.69572 type:complete len:204 (+) Transcript_43759:212-823(+)
MTAKSMVSGPMIPPVSPRLFVSRRLCDIEEWVRMMGTVEPWTRGSSATSMGKRMISLCSHPTSPGGPFFRWTWRKCFQRKKGSRPRSCLQKCGACRQRLWNDRSGAPILAALCREPTWTATNGCASARSWRCSRANTFCLLPASDPCRRAARGPSWSLGSPKGPWICSSEMLRNRSQSLLQWRSSRSRFRSKPGSKTSCPWSS